MGGKLPAEHEKPGAKKVRTLKHSTNAVIGVWNQCADARGQTGCAAGDDAGWKDKGDDRKGNTGRFQTESGKSGTDF